MERSSSVSTISVSIANSLTTKHPMTKSSLLIPASPVVKAASLALADVPEANSAWLGETIRQ